MARRDCPLCGEELEDAPAVHDVAKCEKTELEKGRVTIKKLQASLYEWKYGTGGWFELRDIIGNLWWHHPAIDNDEQRAYYQNNLKAIRELNNGQATVDSSSASDSRDQGGQVQNNDGNDSPGGHGQGEHGSSETSPGQSGDSPNP